MTRTDGLPVRPLVGLGGRLIAIIAAVEGMIMAALAAFPVPERLEPFIDPVALSLLCTPLTLIFVVVPLLRLVRDAEAGARARELELASQASRQDLDARIARALGMARTDHDVAELVEHVSGAVLPGHAAELLLADSSEAHLRRLAGVGGRDGTGAGCQVSSPWDCAAVRNGATQTFSSAGDVDACPRLRDAPHDRSAVCTPVPFLGRNLGVFHVTGSPGVVPSSETVLSIRAIAAHTGQTVGTLRAFAAVTTAATTDALTGLSNRRHLEELIRGARRSGRQLAVLFADLDEFKHLNDVYGHEAGDRALRCFAGILRSECRDGTLLGRWGGEEFLVAMPGAVLDEAQALAERIRVATQRDSGEPQLSVSIGVSAGDGLLEDLVESADAALYEAKRAGRNRVAVAALAA